MDQTTGCREAGPGFLRCPRGKWGARSSHLCALSVVPLFAPGPRQDRAEWEDSQSTLTSQPPVPSARFAAVLSSVSFGLPWDARWGAHPVSPTSHLGREPLPSPSTFHVVFLNPIVSAKATCMHRAVPHFTWMPASCQMVSSSVAKASVPGTSKVSQTGP